MLDAAGGSMVPPGRLRWKSIATVAATATLFTAMQGLNYPLLPVIRDRRGLHEAFIGFNTEMMPLRMVFAAPICAALMHRIGAFALAALRISGAIVCLVLIGAISDSWAPSTCPVQRTKLRVSLDTTVREYYLSRVAATESTERKTSRVPTRHWPFVFMICMESPCDIPKPAAMGATPACRRHISPLAQSVSAIRWWDILDLGRRSIGGRPSKVDPELD